MKKPLILAAMAMGCIVAPGAFANSLCASFTPDPGSNPGTLVNDQVGPVCTVDGITVSNLHYVFNFDGQTNNPGTIYINVVDTTPDQFTLVFTSDNGWIENGGTDGLGDFSVFYDLTPGGPTANPWGPPAVYVPQIVGAQMKATGDTGWDPSTDPATGFTGEVQGTDAFTVSGYPVLNSDILQDPSAINSGGCLATYTCNPFTVTGPLITYTTPFIAQGTSSPTISVEKDINLEGGDNAGDYAKVTRVDQIYYLSSSVPEPISLVLIGGGLIGIAIISKKKARLS